MNISIGVTQQRGGNSYNDLVTQLRNRVVIDKDANHITNQIESINCYNNYVNRTTHI
jgi:hypothetical protein